MLRKSCGVWIIALSFLFGISFYVWGQEPRQDKAKIKVLSIKPDTAGVTFEIEVPGGWHIYPAGKKPTLGLQTVFTFEGAEISGPIEEAAPKIHDDPVLGKYDYHEGRITIRVPLEYKLGASEVKGTIQYQICDENLCLNGTAPFAFPVPQALGLFLLACVGGGLVSLVMPCVYPLLPLTITFFAKQAGSEQAKSFALAFMYGLGIIVTFTGLGFLLSVFIGAYGAQQFAANPWVNLTITLVFFYLALALFGAVPLQLPSFVTNRVAGGLAPKQGYIGAFGLGLIFSVVTFTCTIPVAAGLLSLAASGRHTWALLGMFVYSFTIAVPFFCMGLFPKLLKKIPKSGGWLHTVKIVAAFLELALCTYYFTKADFSFGWNFLSRNAVLAIWIGTCAFTAFYLLGMWRFREDEPTTHIGVARMFWALAFAGLALFLTSGLSGKHLGSFESLLPYDASVRKLGAFSGDGSKIAANGGSAQGEELEDLDKALELAKGDHKPIFVEFTGFS